MRPFIDSGQIISNYSDLTWPHPKFEQGLQTMGLVSKTTTATDTITRPFRNFLVSLSKFLPDPLDFHYGTWRHLNIRRTNKRWKHQSGANSRSLKENNQAYYINAARDGKTQCWSMSFSGWKKTHGLREVHRQRVWVQVKCPPWKMPLNDVFVISFNNRMIQWHPW